MNLMLEGQVAIVTGASAGIGRATAELLAREGALVVAAARGPIELDEGHVEAVRVDLTEPTGPRQLVERALALHGRVDAIVNNVGGVVSHDGFLAIDDDSWAATLELNLMTAVRCSRAAIPALLERGGSLVHVSSEAGRLSDPGILDYAAAKAGLRILSKGLAREFGARGVRSNVVAPGPTRAREYQPGVQMLPSRICVPRSAERAGPACVAPRPRGLAHRSTADVHLDELLAELPEWTRVHTSTVAVESFAQTLALLHDEGALVVQDIFVRSISQYAAYRGPGWLEGPIVN